MAKSRRKPPPRVRRAREVVDTGGGDDAPDKIVEPGTTGRYLVLMREDAAREGVKAITEATGLRVASSSDFEGEAVTAEDMSGADALFFDQLGVAVVDAPPDQMQFMAAAGEESAILAIEPERVVYAVEEDWPSAGGVPLPPPEPVESPAFSLDYWRGYRDAVNNFVNKMLGLPAEEAAPDTAVAAVSETELTWGLHITKAAASRFTGKGMRVAVLDTGLDLGHPDFAGRAITSKSFVRGQTVQDGHGHGTHCIGTACGPRRPNRLPRYGIAFEAEVFAGKVLSNEGSGPDAGILAGINWAVANKCQVVSMSLGADVQVGQSFSQVFERAAQRSLDAGTLIVAAAGNESSRPGFISPVGHPANCPSIMAVAAIDKRLHVASFSCGGLNPQGGHVDISGPGVAVRSSWPRPTLYRTINGTSMATPHVAGIAAQWAQSNRKARGHALWNLLTQRARRLPLAARDVGVGLVQSP